MELKPRSEGRNQHASTGGGYARNVPAEDSAIASLDSQFVDRDDFQLLRTVTELHSVQNASRNRKVGRVITANNNAAVTGFSQISLYGRFRERPVFGE